MSTDTEFSIAKVDPHFVVFAREVLRNALSHVGIATKSATELVELTDEQKVSMSLLYVSMLHFMSDHALQAGLASSFVLNLQNMINALGQGQSPIGNPSFSLPASETGAAKVN